MQRPVPLPRFNLSHLKRKKKKKKTKKQSSTTMGSSSGRWDGDRPARGGTSPARLEAAEGDRGRGLPSRPGTGPASPDCSGLGGLRNAEEGKKPPRTCSRPGSAPAAAPGTGSPAGVGAGRACLSPPPLPHPAPPPRGAHQPGKGDPPPGFARLLPSPRIDFDLSPFITGS